MELAGLFEKELEALRGVERAKGGAGNGESVEIRSRLDPQRGELSWHGQNIGRVVELEIGREWQKPAHGAARFVRAVQAFSDRLKSHLRYRPSRCVIR